MIHIYINIYDAFSHCGGIFLVNSGDLTDLMMVNINIYIKQ